MPIVTEAGFAPDDAPDWAGADAPGACVLLQPGENPRRLAPHLGRIALIGVTASGFADGRAFSTARVLRSLGYRGRLRVVGPIIADQWPLARAVGFDEAAIPEALAARQPEAHWRAAVAPRPAAPFRARAATG